MRGDSNEIAAECDKAKARIAEQESVGNIIVSWYYKLLRKVIKRHFEETRV